MWWKIDGNFGTGNDLKMEAMIVLNMVGWFPRRGKIKCHGKKNEKKSRKVFQELFSENAGIFLFSRTFFLFFCFFDR